MSLITRCPACATTFKVVADQLRISDGWVRCGQCTDVFDASAHLVSDAATAETPGWTQPAGTETMYSVTQPAALQSASAPSFLKSQPAAGGHPSFEPTGPGDISGGSISSRSDPVAEQLARLDLTSVRPTPSVGHDTAQQANPDPFELGEFFDTDLNPDPDNRSKPERERFPVLSIPDLTMPVTPSPPSPMPVVPAATLQPQPGDNERPMGPVGGLEFPVRPSSAVRHDGWADREEPVLHDEVSPSLLSESVATASAGDLSAQWAADPEPETVQIVSAAAPAGEPAKSNRAATDEVENDGRPDEGIESLMFLRQARSRAFWAQSWVKVSMALLTLILLVLLGGQVLFVERNRLAAIEPRLQPLLGAMCRALGCDLGPFRRIEPLLIESSSFNKTKGEAFQLGLALHNASKWPLGMPSAELTLTDSQDQPVLRRVLTPKNLGAPAVLAPGADWSVSLPVSVTGAAGLHIAGYRMLVFYP